jgi:hypothetical protein
LEPPGGVPDQITDGPDAHTRLVPLGLLDLGHGVDKQGCGMFIGCTKHDYLLVISAFSLSANEEAEPLMYRAFCPDNVILVRGFRAVLPQAQYQRLQGTMMTKALYT